MADATYDLKKGGAACLPTFAGRSVFALPWSFDTADESGVFPADNILYANESVGVCGIPPCILIGGVVEIVRPAATATTEVDVYDSDGNKLKDGVAVDAVAGTITEFSAFKAYNPTVAAPKEWQMKLIDHDTTGTGLALKGVFYCLPLE